MPITKSINIWSLPGGLADTLAPLDAIRMAKDNGFPAIELSIGAEGPLNVNTPIEDALRIRMEAQNLGITIPSTASGLYWGRALADADANSRSQAKDDLQKMLRLSAALGARTHLTIPGAVDVFFLPDRAALPYEHVWKYATEGIREVLPVAEEVRVRIGIENVWNKFLLSPQEMAHFIDQFNSPWVGAYVDVANCLNYGHPADWIRHLGKRVVGVHFKDYRRAVGTGEGFVDLLAGDVPWPDVMVALREVGYDGPVPAEMIPNYKYAPEVQVRNTSTALDAILKF
ncbi:MAG: sugar phosphate isomerase/epimerase [Fimbriimonadaceae bacterium]|nr:sugar phosphate isomerase/epimerase [Fimbriimonadaceae bacterium]